MVVMKHHGTRRCLNAYVFVSIHRRRLKKRRQGQNKLEKQFPELYQGEEEHLRGRRSWRSVNKSYDQLAALD